MYKLANKSFKSKNEIIENCKRIRDAYGLSNPIMEKDLLQDDNPDFHFLKSLLKHHPYRELKEGPGIDHFVVGHHMYGTKCFYIVRTDGSRIDVSWNECLKNIKK